MLISTEKIKHQMQSIKNKAAAKKTLIAVIASAFVITGIGATQLPQSVALAAEQQFDHRSERHNYNPELMAQNMQDCFGIDKQTVLDYQAKGWRFSDLHRAAFIAYAGKQDLSNVLNAKTVTNSWKDVSASFGITTEQYRSARTTLMSTQLATRLDLSSNTVTSLISNGYHPRDIAMAATLSKKSDQTIDAILAMKKINNRWGDVATSLGLSNEVYEQCRQDTNNCFGSHQGLGKNFDKNDGQRGFHQDDYRYHNMRGE